MVPSCCKVPCLPPLGLQIPEIGIVKEVGTSLASMEAGENVVLTQWDRLTPLRPPWAMHSPVSTGARLGDEADPQKHNRDLAFETSKQWPDNHSLLTRFPYILGA